MYNIPVENLTDSAAVRVNIFERTQRRYRLFRRAVMIAGALVFLTLLDTLRQSESVAEFWSIYISQFVVFVFGGINSLLPFSLFECLIIAAFAGGTKAAASWFVTLFRRQFYKALSAALSLILACLVFACVYTGTAGFCYYRGPVDVPLSGYKYSGDDTAAAAEFFFSDFAALSEKLPRDKRGRVISPYSFSELSSLIAKEYERVGGDYFFRFTPKAKRIANNWAPSIFRITGITFIPTGEANVNGATPPSSLPHTVAHELAHAKGVMREADANLAAYYLLVSSQDEYLRYCGYYACGTKLLTAVSISNIGRREVYERVEATFPDAVKAEYSDENAFWDSFPDIAGEISDFFNSLYLNLNGAGNGTGSYDDDWSVKPTEKPDGSGGTAVEYEVEYSDVHKMFFALYEAANGYYAK